MLAELERNTETLVIDKLSGDLTAAVLAFDDLSAQKEGEKSRLEAENAKLKEQLESTENGNSSTSIEATEIINEFNGYQCCFFHSV